MDATAMMDSPPALDDIGILLDDVNMFLKKSRERACAPPVHAPAAEQVQSGMEIRSWEIYGTPAPREAPEAYESLEPLEPLELRETEEEQEGTAITQRQLRALKRKHLLVMIRDLEEELWQVKKEKTEMLLAYQAGCGPAISTHGAREIM